MLLVAALACGGLVHHGRPCSVGRRGRTLTVGHYDVQLEPNLASRSIAGTAVVTIIPAHDGVETVTLNRGNLDIDRISENGSAREFKPPGNQLVTTLPRVRSWRRRTVTIVFHGAPRLGLMLITEREQVYTLFSTAQWMPGGDAPDTRATLRLRLVIPRAWQAAGRCRAGAEPQPPMSSNGGRWQHGDLPRADRVLVERRVCHLHGRGVPRIHARPDVYLADISSMRDHVGAVAARGNDRPLIFPTWERPTADDRVIVYQKGALVLHELRELIGDTAFWSGIRGYTLANFGKAVSTADLRNAMEQASGTDLSEFFARWVYLR